MGRRSTTGGATAKGERIQLDFAYPRKGGPRYRPTLDVPPTEENLALARARLLDVKARIKQGTFVFLEEFPEYRFPGKVAGSRRPPPHRNSLDAIADRFLASIKGEVAYATYVTYDKILRKHWRPQFGKRAFLSIGATELREFIGSTTWKTAKTRNNVASVGRRVFEFGYSDYPTLSDPAVKLKTLRVQRPRPDPFTLDEAEAIIAGIPEDAGAEMADYFEFQFFAGCRPSETIALTWSDYDKVKGTLRVRAARVMGKDKSTTKTSVEREVELCPRARDVVERQRTRSELSAHKRIFTKPGGEPWHDLQAQWRAWQQTLTRLGIRYREPYQCRHTSVTWNLMLGKNPLWIADQHGHSPLVMLRTYAKWLRGTSQADIAALERAIKGASASVPARPTGDRPTVENKHLRLVWRRNE